MRPSAKAVRMRGAGMSLCFFFQAEDGIRDADVTGVQTCALPICGQGVGLVRELARRMDRGRRPDRGVAARRGSGLAGQLDRGGAARSRHRAPAARRSEERRVGEEGRMWWWAWGSKREMAVGVVVG